MIGQGLAPVTSQQRRAEYWLVLEIVIENHILPSSVFDDLFQVVVLVSASINDGWFIFQSGQYTDNKNNHLMAAEKLYS